VIIANSPAFFTYKSHFKSSLKTTVNSFKTWTFINDHHSFPLSNEPICKTNITSIKTINFNNNH